ncbi:hypothetical protein PINS_up006831 [Pythium insidiosum]|nr:hypothetical protein PINS_up006831 [Pythium insidiosum]
MARKFRQGQKIEARCKGGEKFYPGVIARCRLNGTYDIEYDDGEKESAVKPDLIRANDSPSSPSNRKPQQTDTSEDDQRKKFAVGMKVEVRFKGKDRYYPGVVSRCRLNGTYDIDYDDGEKETQVKADLIKARASSSPRKKPPVEDSSESDVKPKAKFSTGQKVEAKYKGKDKYYPGVIARCRLNGTYDIDYDDGEKETGVAADLIRSKSSSPSRKQAAATTSEDETPKYRVGQKVEAQYKGRSKFYPGVISRCRSNGTFDIDYDDGEKEAGVEAGLIRPRPSTSPKKPTIETSTDEGEVKKKLRVGQPIEARYKGKERYYPGVISRCRLNGTYDIDYDDGEKETGVTADLIKEKSSKSSPKKANVDTSEDDQKRKTKFKEGDKVEAQYKGKSKFYPGVISRCRLNGTYDIDYDDGEKETGVAAELIRLRGGSSSPSKKAADSDDDRKSSRKLKEGDKVEAQYKGKSKFYPGVISRCRLNGTYDIDYDDGEKETGVAAELIRLRGGSSSPSKKKSEETSEDDARGGKKFREGEKVEVQYKGRSKYYPGVISRCRLNGTYDIDYDDGEKETGIAPELIRSLEQKKSPSKKKTADESEDEPKGKKKFREGEKIEAQYKGRSKFYPGVISRCRLNGTYDIDYDDGEKETGVAAELIRSRESSSPSKKKTIDTSEDETRNKKFREGEKVEAQYKGRSKFYPGIISRCRLNGTYDIDYDDGEKETGVAAELIRSREASSPSKKKKADDVSEDDRKAGTFKEGERVEVQYKGKSKYYPGVVSRCRLNGTYDINYDDGEKETGVSADLIRSLEKKATSSDDDRGGKTKFREGEKIEAQYKGKSKFYPGVISRCRLNGTYDIDYDDGEKETGVAAELIRSRESGKDGSGSKKLKEGDKVEAQYKGRSKFYPGVISRCRLNGTYDIDYDDGEKETGVAAELIRLKEGSSPKKKTNDDREGKFREGDKIEAQYKGKSKFYPGVISRCRSNGTYDIDYDDGEKETGVAGELIRLREKGSGEAKKFREADKIEAQYKGKSKFYPGVISRCRLNGTYDIDYDDGEKETGVAAELIRLRGGGDSKQAKAFKEGDKVEAQYKGKSKFYPGVISRCRLNGTYDIDYDDGEKETGVAAELIRLRGGSSSPSKKAADSDDDRKSSRKLKEGDKVEAQYKGKSKFYPGVISRCRLNGTYDIDYDDGEKETGVAAELIRLRGGSSSPSKKKSEETSEDDARGGKKFREGEKVEVQYKGRSKYYPGVISRCRLNGTYDIDYDDGEKETGIAPELIRSLEQKKSPSKKKTADESEDEPKGKKKFREGEKIEAQYKGRSKFYPGVISRCRLNGTYDIDYDDGEKETGVAAELIRSRESSSPSKKKTIDTSEDETRNKKFREGEKVEAQYKGRSKFYPGIISRCRLNGTYDIDYDDGEKETGVAAELIRSREASSPSKKKKADDVSEDDRKAGTFKEGERVEVQYKGKSKYYPGVVSRCRLNGTYDINYDDGEKETGVSADLIRSLEKKATSSDDDRGGKTKFREGEKIEAQYKGKSKFYPGVISRCRLNGTYDIDYDDGEKETGVAAELIRSRESGKDGSGSKKLKEGDKVEAQYKGRSKFYPGVISRCRLNGTYDIDYDDGEKETGVAAELIRLKEGSSPKKKTNDDREGKFREGDKIEAQYKGKSKFYPGVISRCRSNGTYDIDYDDGEKETGVAGELIRLREKGSGEAKKFREADKIEAQYKGKSKFYPGVISRCRLNGTYDIDYDDGEKETGVAAELIRLRGGGDSKQAKAFKEGDKVEAQYKGKSKFYPGVISRCRLNGTYDIDYDDGEKETGVAAELIRLRGGSSSPSKKAADSDDDRKSSRKLKEGDKVEAQYKGKSKFYPGVISRCRLNGTYDIDYDDGEKETGVAAELIRLRGGSSSPSKKKSEETSEDDARGGKKFREGEKVEVQYKGRSKYYPGVISRCRLNGTYDIDYDDGEKETGIAPELIRSLEQKKSPSKKSVDDSDARRTSSQGSLGQTYRVGARVEALFRGKDKYFKGTISRAHADGTYDIEYDDGDKETHVVARNIRPLKTTNFSATAEFSAERPIRPSTSGGARRRSGNSSD